MVKQGTLEKVEEVVDLDEIIEIRQFNNFLRQRWVIPSISAIGGVAVGLGIAKILKRREIDKIYETANQELQELRTEQLKLDFERAEKDREFNQAIANASDVSQQLAQRGNELLNTLKHLKPGSVIAGEVLVPAPPEELEEKEIPQPQPEVSHIPPEERPDGDRRLSKAVSQAHKIVEQVERPVHNVFGQEDYWDYETELMTRNPENPYIIHVDEYSVDEMGYNNQQTFIYYEGDDILVDHRSKPVFRYENVVGKDLKFGHGSRDPNVVFVRNERLQAEYEILRDPGKYTDVVAGEEIEREFESADLRHMNTPRRFRDD